VGKNTQTISMKATRKKKTSLIINNIQCVTYS